MSQYTYQTNGWKHRKSLSSFLLRLWRYFRKTPVGKNLYLFIIFFIFLSSLLLLGIMAFASKDLPNPNSLTQRKISQTTKIYDRTGEHLLYEIAGNQNRTLKKLQLGFCNPTDPKLSLDKKGIPLFAVQATIAAEDRKFCEHGGFDIKGIARAFFQNIIGNRVGGSTLTQQLVKNAILSREKTLTRKVKELILSIELEQKYSKDTILQIYFNEIPYGSSYYGIEAASQNFFGKTVSDLSLSEAATLAALPKSPTTYLNNPDSLKARRNYILSEMQKLNFINSQQLEDAKKVNTPVNLHITNITAPHFVMDVKAALEEKYGRRDVEEGGLKVITTLDYRLQQIAEEEIKKGVGDRGQQYGFVNASLVAEDPKTGQILAMVGSKDFFDKSIDGQVNVATRLRQPGSSFKPIVYAKAFEMGYSPNTVLWDVVTEFPTAMGPYTPHNYNLKEHGPVRMRDALQMSLNIPAVKTVYLVGVDQALDFATSLGYSSFSNHSNFGLSIVLGGGEVRLVDHVNAYATFANEGIKNDQVSILSVEDANENILEQWKPKEGHRVISENVAREISSVLSDNNARTPIFGSTSSLQLGERPVAAKSGTTNDFHDAWLMGYTPSLVTGVWVGNNNNTPMKNKADGSVVAGPVWNAFMKRSLEGSVLESFISPDIPVTGKLVLDGNLPSQSIVIDRASEKLATEYTPESFKETRFFGGYHSILHFITPSNPTGPTPDHPENDPQYEAWEKGILNWVSRREKETGIKILQTNPPTESDNLHIPANFPSINIILPKDNTFIDGQTITVSTKSSAPRGISRIEYYIDDLYLGYQKDSSLSFITQIPSSISEGLHTIKAVAYDDIDNNGSDTKSAQFHFEKPMDTFEIIDPKNSQEIEKNTDNYTIVISIKNPVNYTSVVLYAEQNMTGIKSIIGQTSNPNSPFITSDWKIPNSGTWILSATAKSKNNSSLMITAGIRVKIKESSFDSNQNNSITNSPLDPFFKKN